MRLDRILVAALAPALAAASLAMGGDAGVEAAFGRDGLTALKYAGADLLKDGKPAVTQVFFEKQGVNEKGEKTYTFEKIENSQGEASFDAGTGTLTHKYPWGSAAFAFAARADRLNLTVTMANSSKDTLADFSIRLFRIRFPAKPAGLKDKGTLKQALDNLAVAKAEFDRGVLLFCDETIEPPLRIGFGPLQGDGNAEADVLMSGGVWVPEPGAYEVPPHGYPRIAAGKSQAFQLSFRFAPPGTANDAVIADLYAKFAEAWKPRHEWKDRRPIGMLMLASAANIHHSKTNPRGWFNEPKLDVTTDAGKEDFKKRSLAYADRALKCLKNTDAQGMIVWDMEGEENPHPITYVGDPRMAKVFAPEMDEAADAFFKAFLDAGFRTGVCIRPTQVYFDAEKKQWKHGTGSHGPERNPLNDKLDELRPKDLPWWRFFPVVERMSAKIEFAKKRWGCTIFYIDTNGIFRPVGEDGKFQWQLLNANMWKRLKELHPDVLLIPELVGDDFTYHAAYWACTAPYFQLDMGTPATPAVIQKIFPEAFSVIRVCGGAPFDKKKDEVLAGVKRGDILLFTGWFDSGESQKVKAVYDEAKKAKAGEAGK